MTHQRPAPHTPPAALPDGPGNGSSPSRRGPSSVRARRGLAGDRGMTTAEYAVGTVAACGFGAVLYKAVTSDAVGRLLRGVLEQALSVSFL
jgi:hypothetical protein